MTLVRKIGKSGKQRRESLSEREKREKRKEKEPSASFAFAPGRCDFFVSRAPSLPLQNCRLQLWEASFIQSHSRSVGTHIILSHHILSREMLVCETFSIG